MQSFIRDKIDFDEEKYCLKNIKGARVAKNKTTPFI